MWVVGEEVVGVLNITDLEPLRVKNWVISKDMAVVG